MPSVLSKNPSSLTELEKRIYNSFLIQYRKSKGQPFKVRKDFSGFEDTAHYPIVKRIANFFKRYPDVDIDSYFSAPYAIYPDTPYFDLKYFASPRGIKAYTIFKMMQDKDLPDHRVDRVKECLGFVVKFCQENKISIYDYANFYKSGNAPEWMYHVKKNQLEPFFMMAYPNVLPVIESVPEDEREFLLGDFGVNFLAHRHKYNISSKLYPILSSILPKLQNIIKPTN